MVSKRNESYYDSIEVIKNIDLIISCIESAQNAMVKANFNDKPTWNALNLGIAHGKAFIKEIEDVEGNP